MTATNIDFASTLNEQQLAAVTHEDGSQLVIAGAGSGKTRVITYRIAWLVQQQGVDPGHIAAVTFTNKAAAEMRERLEELLGLYPLPTFVGTYHRFALRLLRMYGQRVSLPRNFTTLDTGDQLTQVKRAMKAANIPEESFRPRAVLSGISSAKNQLLGPALFERQADDFYSKRVARVYQHYQAQLRDAGAIDFDDMIRLAVQLLRTQPSILKRVRARTRHLLVDEFQDTNHAQMCLIEELVGPHGQLTAVGDEDQGIYRWRGAELSNILDFEKTFDGATVRKLERNYRSTQTILDASGAVVANNEKRRGKELWTDEGEGEQVLLFRARDEQDEARWVANTLRGLSQDHSYKSMAVLVRTNAQTRSLEDAFRRQELPYHLIAGVRFYERAEIKDLIAYLRLMSNPEDLLAFERVLNRPARGIGKKTESRFYELAKELGVTPWKALVETKIIDTLPGRAASALRRYRDLMVELRQQVDGLPLPAMLRSIVEATGYLDQYNVQDSDDQTRIENIDELLSSAQEFTEKNIYGAEDDDLLGTFLDHVALVSDTDGLGGGGVAMMTMHSAKGLEFEVVVVAGLEEGLLPHFNSRDDPDSIEEERRLLYVGMTRAEERLILTVCRRRRIAGQYQDQEESRFLSEIPTDLVIAEHSSELFSSPGGSGYGRSGFGGGRPSARSGFGTGNPSKAPASSRQQDDVFSFFGKETTSKPESESSWSTANESPMAAAVEPPNLRLPFEPRPPTHELRRGTRVRHGKLGLGKIMSIEGSGDTARLIVYFEGVGRRKLVAKYANLDIL